jgi:hypothetical protein
VADTEFAFPFEILERLAPADAESTEALHQLGWIADSFVVLAYHQAEREHPVPTLDQPVLFDGGPARVAVETAAILLDSSAIYDIPGTAELVAVHLQRTRGTARFRLRAERVPTPALAERWLAGQGIDPSTLTPAVGTVRTTDSASRAAEQRIATDRTGRYEVVDHYTHENGPVFVLYRDHQSGLLPPYLAQAEILDLSSSPLDYRVIEARFTAPADAQTWHLDDFPPTAPAVATARPAANGGQRPQSSPPQPRRRR